MFIQPVLFLALLGVALATSIPGTLLSRPKHILQPPLGGTKTVIRGLLSGRVSSRQTSGCDVGYSVCDSNYCCPTDGACCSGGFCCGAGYYCDTVQGVLGCCPNGEICTETSNECSSAGYSPCPNDTYCCPTGETCFRDTSNTPSCSSSGGGGGGGGSTTINPPPPPPASSSFGFSSSAPPPPPPVTSHATSTKNTLTLAPPPTSSSSGSGSSSGGVNGGSAVGLLADIRGIAVLSIVGALTAFVL